MPSRRKRKQWRKRYGLSAEATARVKTPENAPRDEALAGTLRGKLSNEPESRFFQDRREFYEDTLLVRRAMREDWPVSQEQRRVIPAAVFDAFMRVAPDAPADAGVLEKYHFKIGHRLSAVRLMMAMERISIALDQADARRGFRGEPEILSQTRELEGRR